MVLSCETFPRGFDIRALLGLRLFPNKYKTGTNLVPYVPSAEYMKRDMR